MNKKSLEDAKGSVKSTLERSIFVPERNAARRSAAARGGGKIGRDALKTAKIYELTLGKIAQPSCVYPTTAGYFLIR
ncbi:MAG: hypothetical protein ACYDC3_20445 [Candidatus Binataceae bacterium]